MKKTLLTIMAIFSMLPFLSAIKPGSDVVATYMVNYTKPFATTSNMLIGTNTRWKEAAPNWVQANGTGSFGSSCTSWHVDSQKGSALTLTSSWDGFAANVTNMKIYQTFTLPAGTYDLVTSCPEDAGGAGATYLVVDDAVGLPDEAGLAANALAYSKASDSLLVHFTLAAPTPVSVGLVAGAQFGEWNCMTIGTFQLIQYVEGTNFTYLNRILTAAKGMTSANYPTGTTAGKYSPEKWNALQTAITNADAIVAKGDAATQAEVDGQTATLRTAIAELKASLVYPFKLSDETTTTWYQVHDKRPTNVYWKAGAVGSYASALNRSTTNSAVPAQLFKFVKNPSTPAGLYIYNKVNSAVALTGDVANNVVRMESSLTPTSWLVETSPVADYYIIKTESAGKQLNSYGDKIAFWNDINDVGNQWTFVELDLGALKSSYAALRTQARGLYANTVQGTDFGQYSAASRSAFDGVIAAEEAKNVDAMNSDQLFAAMDVLNSAISTYMAAINSNPVSLLSTDANKYRWYWVRSTCTVADRTGKVISAGTRAVAENYTWVDKVVDASDNAQLFRFELNAAQTKVLNMIDKKGNYMASNGKIATASTSGNEFTLIPLTDGLSFNIKPTSLDALHAQANGVHIVNWASGAGSASAWVFDFALETPKVFTAVEESKAVDYRICINDGIITVDGVRDFEIYSAVGQQQNIKSVLKPGVYVVKFEGFTRKVVVK